MLNQVSERSGLTPRSFQQTLVETVGWAPPVAAILPFDPAVTQAQDNFLIPVTRSEGFAKGIQAIVQALFRDFARFGREAETHKKSGLRLPRIRIGS